MPRQQNLQRAYEQGASANEDGESFDSNLYTSPHSALGMAWSQGWIEQQQVREEWEQGNHDRARMWG